MEDIIKYPIYRIEVVFIEKGVSEHYPNRGLIVPKGYILNDSSLTLMRKEKLDYNEQLQEIVKFKERVEKSKRSSCKDSRDILEWINLKIDFVGEDSWVGGRFSHHTLRISGKDDQYYLRSFREYIERAENTRDRNSYGDLMPTLMGADDRWRWRSMDGGEAPCNCKDCIKQGIVRIDH